MDRQDEADVRDLLAELETRLAELRDELHDRPTTRQPRPPTAGEVLRFTEEHTIPTLIATLEATIEALELGRATLRIARGASPADTDDRPSRPGPLAAAGDSAGATLQRALDELGAALDDVGFPDNREARSAVEEIETLRATIEDRLAGDPADTDAVEIDVTTDDGDGRSSIEDAGDDVGGDADRDGAAVDVEAELRSLREEAGRPVDEADPDGSVDGTPDPDPSDSVDDHDEE